VIYRASVTFENESSAPETIKATIEAAGHQTAARRALDAAKRALPNRKPSSIVLVLDWERDRSGKAPRRPSPQESSAS
jgi:hypothetical protein